MEPDDHDGDPARELAALVAAFSAALARHARAGAWGASAAATPRPALREPAAGTPGPVSREPAAMPMIEAPSSSLSPSSLSSAGGGEVRSRAASGATSMTSVATSMASAASGSAGPLDDSLGRFDEVPPPTDDFHPADDDFGFDLGAPSPAGSARAQPTRGRGERSASAGRVASAASAAADDGPVFTRPRKTLAMVREELGDCQRCKLARTRGKLVFGNGAEDASLVFIGEAPGADEDRTGEPFVGRAGELLDKMIEAMGWSRRSVYVANLLKCRPPQNRNPEPDEAKECRPFLIAQLEVISPRIIIALGRPSANALLGTDAPISTLRGKFHERWGLRIMPTFHPAYLLREPAKKREAWSDLKLVMQELERIGVAPRT